MELLLFYKTTVFFLISQFVFFLSAYAASDQARFISCGSSMNTTTADGRTFVGDIKPEGFRLCSQSKDTVKDSNPANSTNVLYQSARVFRKPSGYVFDIQQTGTYILRLHFYAFKSSPELAEAKFNVSASGHVLLSDFGVGSGAADSLVLKEFLINISTTREFQVRFVPNHGNSSLAFISAIELISTNLSIKGVTGDHVTPARSMGMYRGQTSETLETLYRINVGGEQVTDSLWRTWTPDDQYLISKNAAKNAPVLSTGVTGFPATDEDYAPQKVYQTAKQSSANKDSSVVSNVTWQFNVSKDMNLFVRVHFCDIISLLSTYSFNLYFYENFVDEINPYSRVNQSEVPFFEDYFVETVSLEFINISIGSSGHTGSKTYLFLNGLEIMQVKNGTALDPPPCPPNSASKMRPIIIVLIGASIVLLVVVVAAVVLLGGIKRKAKPVEAFEWAMVALYGATSSHNRASEKSSSQASNLSNLHLGLKIPFVEVQQVTNNFDADLIIGQGGFGKVYKGTLKNGDKVAVKRSDPDHGQGLSEFQTEIMVLSKIRHRHLVSLIGYCYEDSEMILVYEFMEKGTLRDHLYDSEGGKISGSTMWLSWKQRLEICIGAAKGLHYLHTGAGRTVIHRDVKSTNILLDERYVAKVADFGLSRLGHLEQTHISTDIKGTFGYLDPEYFRCRQLTDKSDVYSFGVVLLEVLCARAVIDRSLPKEQVNLADWIMACHAEGNLEKTIDPSLVDSVNQNSLKKFIETAAKCLKEYAEERPVMSDVIWDLEYALQLQKEETQTEMLGDSITGASMTLPFLADERFSSQNFADVNQDYLLNYSSTGEVFSQLGFDDAAR